MIVFFIIAAFFGWLQNLTGINAFIWVAIFISAFLLFVFVITKSSKEEKVGVTSTLSMEDAIAIVRREEKAADQKNIEKLEALIESGLSGTAMFEKLSDFINFPIIENNDKNNTWTIERIYLSIRYHENEKRSKSEIKKAIFDYPRFRFSGNSYFRMDGQDEKSTEIADRIINSLYHSLITDLSDGDLERLLQQYFVPIFNQKPDRFPTCSSMINVAAIGKDAFLETELFEHENGWLDTRVVQRAFTMAELRAESSRLKALAGAEPFDRFLNKSVKSLHDFSRKSLEKVSAKQNVNASDLKNGLRWAASLCFAAEADSIATTEETASTLLGKVDAGKRTKAMEAAVSDLEAFLAYPKGMGTQRQADRQEHLLAELQQAAQFVVLGSEPEGREYFNETLELARRVLLLPNAACQKKQLDELADVLKFARLNVATLDDDDYVSKTSVKLVEQLKIVNERRKKGDA